MNKNNTISAVQMKRPMVTPTTLSSAVSAKRFPLRELNVPKMQKTFPPREISNDRQQKFGTGQGKITKTLAISNLTKSQLFFKFENLSLQTDKVEASYVT